MIKFFRKVRQQLLNKNRFGKYLIYAFGEIILVVIGILIALKINTWNTERLNRIMEIDILNELHVEYKNKLTELNQKVELRNLMISSSSELLNLIHEENYNISQDSLIGMVALTTLTPTYDASNSVTEELLNSGNLYILQNSNLRKLILDWKSQLNKLVEEEQILLHVLINNYIPYLSKRVPYKNIGLSFLKENTDVWKFITRYTKNQDYIIAKSKQKVNIKDLFNDLEFESYLSTINFGSILANMHSENIRNRIENVMNLLKSEINEKTKQ